MMIMSINRNTKQVKVTSLMRDMYVAIRGYQDNRINVAYGNGGPKLLADTIQNNFRVKIDNYVMVNFSNFQNLVNLVGGVEIKLTSEEAAELNNHSDVYFSESETKQTGPRVTYRAGTMTLNGTSALAYSRIRHIDSDFNRTQRQRNVIAALMSKVKRSNIGTLVKIANEVFPLIKTDIPLSQILSFANDASGLTSNSLKQCRLPVDGAFTDESIRGMAVLYPNIEKNKKALWKFIYDYQG
jgi:LCP family protein required for cell wall assembly